MLSPEKLMESAIACAAETKPPDLPIGAVIVDGSGFLLARATNLVEASRDSTAHAEMLALRSLNMNMRRQLAGRFTIAVTLEPCPMCAWAIRSFGIGRVVFGAFNKQYGAAGSVYDLLRDGRFGKRVEVIGGVLQEKCADALASAFDIMR